MSTSLSLQAILEQRVELPSCPQVLLKLMGALGTADVQSRQLVEIISADPALTLEVIRVANSPFYGAARQIRSLSDALIRLGFNEIWTIASALKTKEMFATSNAAWTIGTTRIWEHSLRVAAATRALSSALNPPSIEALFTVGILHDCGKLVLLRAFQGYSYIIQQDQVWGAELIEKEHAAFGSDHAEIGAQVMEHWKLPGNIVKLVDEHHLAPAECSAPRAVGLIALADQLARRASIPVNPPVDLPASALQDAGVHPQMLPGIFKAYEASYRSLKSI